MNILTGKRERTEAERADGAGAGSLSRRSILGGVATLPVLYGVGSAATPAVAATAVRRSGAPKVTGDLVRGMEWRYNAPLLTSGTGLVLPAGVKALPIQDYYSRPHLASTESVWPWVTATDGTTVDASFIPERGAPTRIAMLSGFTEGWCEISHASGRDDRLTWDIRRFPFLWLYGEFGATKEAPYHNWFYTLALQPFSTNPYSRNTVAR